MDTPRRLRLLSLGGRWWPASWSVWSAPGVLRPGLLAVPGRGRHRPADPGAADPDQPADRRRDRDQRVPGRRAGAAGAAGQYDQALTTTGALIAEAAQAQPADAEALAALNQQVVGYAAAIEQARANNRQGLPVGAQYLRSASAQLRGEALPILDNLVAANADRAEDRMEIWIGLVFVIVAALGLAAVVVGQVWLARRFRRTINLGMLAAHRCCCWSLLVGGRSACCHLNSAVGTIQNGSFAAVNAAADARIDANNAKSNESLTLIARGSGAAFETAWKASADSVPANLDRLGPARRPTQWSRYVAVHNEIRTLDDGGQWDAAVALATGSGTGVGQHRVQRLRRQPGRHPGPGQPGGLRRPVGPAAGPGRRARSCPCSPGSAAPCSAAAASPPGSGSTDETSREPRRPCSRWSTRRWPRWPRPA